MDFAGVEAFVPATATITVGGLVGGETVTQSMSYQVGASCTAALLYAGGIGGATFTASGIPAAQQRASDFHGISIAAIAASNAFRSIIEYLHTLSASTVNLGAVMPTPTITTLAGAYKRLQAVYTLPADYQIFTGSPTAMERGMTPSASPRRSVIWAGPPRRWRCADYSAAGGVGQHLAPGLGEHWHLEHDRERQHTPARSARKTPA